MKCPYCGAEVKEDDTFCGECGKELRFPKVRAEENKYWKWGSMIASLVLTFIFWIVCMLYLSYMWDLLIILLIFGFPATIYLMYKERAKKIKYGLAWILFPILTWVIFLHGYAGYVPAVFVFICILLVIPALVIDVFYIYEIR